MAEQNPTFIILPLHASDAPACTTTYFSSFQNAHSLACWPRTPSIRAFWETMIVTELEEPNAHFLKAVATSSTTTTEKPELAAWCKWVAPNPGREPDTALPAWPADSNAQLADSTFGAWARAHAQHMRGRSHYYLEIIATSPAYQRRGLGSRFLEWGTQRADGEGVECYLEASPEAVRLYEKFGFREVGRTTTWIQSANGGMGEEYVNLYMLRKPTARGREGEDGRTGGLAAG